MVRETGWANAMRYLLTGDPWDARTAYQMGIVQEVAHMAINDSADTAAFAQLEAEYLSLFKSQDFTEGRKAETENRPPIFQGR
jgi:enoyl-CoA hydratase/carnithine racemase